MQTRHLMLMAVLPITLLAACQPLTPNLDSHFGEAVNIAKAQQIVNPDASQNPDPVSGVDGKAAQSAVENYEKSFKTPAKTTITNTISIGGGTSGGGSSQ
jgi:hypothetical protein